MKQKMKRPADPYSPDWAEYWRQNPHLNRSVGAGGEGDVDPPVGYEDGEGDGGDVDNTIDPAELARLQKEYNAMKARLDKMDEKNRELLAEKKKTKEAAEKAASEAARKAGDVESLEKSWQEKLDGALAESAGEIEQYKGMVRDLTIGSTATKLAAEVFGEHAELLEHHVLGRLSYDIADGRPVVKVLSSDGKPSALNLDDLKKELTSDKRFAPFVIGSMASGPGAHGKRGAPITKTFDEMTSGELVKLRRESPAEYDRLKAERNKQ